MVNELMQNSNLCVKGFTQIDLSNRSLHILDWKQLYITMDVSQNVLLQCIVDDILEC